MLSHEGGHRPGQNSGNAIYGVMTANGDATTFLRCPDCNVPGRSAIVVQTIPSVSSSFDRKSVELGVDDLSGSVL